MSKFYRIFDGMCWPVPSEEMDDVAWRAVHSHSDTTDLLVMASVVEAYQELIRLPIKARNDIIKELRKGAT